MNEKIKHFPRGEERYRRLSEKKFRVPCQVSMRWLQFPEIAHSFPDGDYMVVNVMTANADEKERKICELVLTKQEIYKMLEKVKVSA